jgi:hypothetical protein
MKCIATSVDEVMTWIDDFCESTGLSPSKAGLLYAELAFTGDFESLIAQVMVRSFSMAEDSDEEYEKGVREILREGYENLSEPAQQEFREHFIRVLVHHGMNLPHLNQRLQMGFPRFAGALVV